MPIPPQLVIHSLEVEPYTKVTPTGQQVQDISYDAASGPDAFELPLPPPVYQNVRWNNRLDGYKNPLWRICIARGENAGTHMTATSKTIEQTPGDFQIKANVFPSGHPNGKRMFVARGALGGLPDFTNSASGVPQGEAVSKAAGKWYAKVSDAMSGFKGSIFAAESREATSMMYDRASKMLTMIPPFQDLLRKRWVRSRTKRGKLKTLSNSWLELQFGWLPLASDIEDAYEVLSEPRPQMKYVSAKGGHWAQEYESSGSESYGIGRLDSTVRITTDYLIKHVGSVRRTESAAPCALLDFGISTREFLPTLWEVLPWSFLQDYFSNIGQVINAISYATVKLNWSCTTITQRRTITMVGQGMKGIVPSDAAFCTIDIDVPSQLVCEAKRVDRFPQVNIPVPDITFHLPKPKQVLNIAALAISRRLRLAY